MMVKKMVTVGADLRTEDGEEDGNCWGRPTNWRKVLNDIKVEGNFIWSIFFNLLLYGVR